MRSARYVAVVAAAFLAPNLPFVLMSPSAWVKGVLTPITSHLVPAGQGAVALSLFLKVGGGSLAAFTAATVILALLLILIYVGTYPLLRMATFMLPALILFFASRSYGNYLVALIPAAVVGAVTIRPSPGQRESHSLSRTATTFASLVGRRVARDCSSDRSSRLRARGWPAAQVASDRHPHDGPACDG